MRDLNNPLALSLFDGEKPPNGGRPSKKSRKIKRKNARIVAKKNRQHEKRMKDISKSKSKSRSKSLPKSKFGEARGISTKTEKKGPVYVSKKEQAKTCANSLPTGAPGGGR